MDPVTVILVVLVVICIAAVLFRR